MMAGTYLDAHSERSRARALIEQARCRIATDSPAVRERVAGRLRTAGFTDTETRGVTRAFERNPEALLNYVAAFELSVPRGTGASPWTHAVWMFVADLVAVRQSPLPLAARSGSVALLSCRPPTPSRPYSSLNSGLAHVRRRSWRPAERHSAAPAESASVSQVGKWAHPPADSGGWSSAHCTEAPRR
jgi:hypothetical protein